MTAIQTFLAALASTLLQKAESVGMTLAAALGQVFLQMGADEREILINVKQKWIDSYNAEIAKGTDILNAIENASTAAYNEFCAEEKDEFAKVKAGIIANLEYAAKQTAGLLTGSVSAS